jgi:hypothetical protein
MTPLVKAIHPAKFSTGMPRLPFGPLTSEAYGPPSLYSHTVCAGLLITLFAGW